MASYENSSNANNSKSGADVKSLKNTSISSIVQNQTQSLVSN